MKSISYNPKLAEMLGSAGSAILIGYVIGKCRELGIPTIIEADVQFELGFSDVEFFSALKTLRENGVMQSNTVRGGKRQYTPIPELLVEEIGGKDA